MAAINIFFIIDRIFKLLPDSFVFFKCFIACAQHSFGHDVQYLHIGRDVFISHNESGIWIEDVKLVKIPHWYPGFLRKEKTPDVSSLGRGQFYLVLKGSENFGTRGSTALSFGGHTRCAFPHAKVQDHRQDGLLPDPRRSHRSCRLADSISSRSE